VTGYEPALPGDPLLFDPVWLAVRELMTPPDDPALWTAAVRELLIPPLRDNRVATRDEPVQVTVLCERHFGSAGAAARSWYFNAHRAGAAGEMVASSADQRMAVGTQLGARAALILGTADPADPDRVPVWLLLKRYGTGPGSEVCLRHEAVRGVGGTWTVGPGRPDRLDFGELDERMGGP
jgi:hypothetical protein